LWVSSLVQRTNAKLWWAIFAISVLCFIITIEIFGQIFFINRTESMPRGIYVKRTKSNIEFNDVIVFYFNEFKGNLIKHVAAISPSEFCFDEEASLWVDGFPIAQINIEKYPGKKPNQSQCQRLMADEILVLGDHPNSYDSRYFGPIKLKSLVAQVELFWEF
jgi:signal peptidase I